MPSSNVVNSRCFNCHEVGHCRDKCPKPPQTLCYNCNKVGHRATECTRVPLCRVCGKEGHKERQCAVSTKNTAIPEQKDHQNQASDATGPNEVPGTCHENKSKEKNKLFVGTNTSQENLGLGGIPTNQQLPTSSECAGRNEGEQAPEHGVHKREKPSAFSSDATSSRSYPFAVQSSKSTDSEVGFGPSDFGASGFGASSFASGTYSGSGQGKNSRQGSFAKNGGAGLLGAAPSSVIGLQLDMEEVTQTKQEAIATKVNSNSIMNSSLLSMPPSGHEYASFNSSLYLAPNYSPRPYIDPFYRIEDESNSETGDAETRLHSKTEQVVPSKDELATPNSTQSRSRLSSNASEDECNLLKDFSKTEFDGQSLARAAGDEALRALLTEEPLTALTALLCQKSLNQDKLQQQHQHLTESLTQRNSRNFTQGTDMNEVMQDAPTSQSVINLRSGCPTTPLPPYPFTQNQAKTPNLIATSNCKKSSYSATSIMSEETTHRVNKSWNYGDYQNGVSRSVPLGRLERIGASQDQHENRLALEVEERNDVESFQNACFTEVEVLGSETPVASAQSHAEEEARERRNVVTFSGCLKEPWSGRTEDMDLSQSRQIAQFSANRMRSWSSEAFTYRERQENEVHYSNALQARRNRRLKLLDGDDHSWASRVPGSLARAQGFESSVRGGHLNRLPLSRPLATGSLTGGSIAAGFEMDSQSVATTPSVHGNNVSGNNVSGNNVKYQPTASTTGFGMSDATGLSQEKDFSSGLYRSRLERLPQASRRLSLMSAYDLLHPRHSMSFDDTGENTLNMPTGMRVSALSRKAETSAAPLNVQDDWHRRSNTSRAINLEADPVGFMTIANGVKLSAATLGRVVGNNAEPSNNTDKSIYACRVKGVAIWILNPLQLFPPP